MLLEYHYSHRPCTELNDADTVQWTLYRVTACNSTTSVTPKEWTDG